MDHTIHEAHDHTHGPECGHQSIGHDDHTDYLHDGHLHHPHNGHTDEHVLEISEKNPDHCTPDHSCAGHHADHVHGPNCGHEAIPMEIIPTILLGDICTFLTRPIATITVLSPPRNHTFSSST